MMTAAAQPILFVAAGESSGDMLGARLLAALRGRLPAIRFMGVGGPAMAAHGLESLFPMADIAVMGIGPVLRRLPTLLERIDRTARAAAGSGADALVLIDSADFSQRVARKVRLLRPDLPIVRYVSPTVWAWRPGRARAMARACDLLLAVLPFEPQAHRLLGGPRTVYVGHPAVERLEMLSPAPGARSAEPGRDGPLRLLVLPGSRRSEVSRLMQPFGRALALAAERLGPVEAVLPAVDHVRGEIERLMADWPIKARLASGEAEKLEAFKAADAALAASGTVTLELALAAVPMVVAYRLDWLAARIRFLIDVPKPLRPLLPVRSIVLPNLILGEAAVPEFIHEEATPEKLAAALVAVARDGAARRRQLSAFARLAARMALPGGRRPSEAAADAVLDLLAQRRSSIAT